MATLAKAVIIDGTKYPAGTLDSAMPPGVADRIRSSDAWVGGTPPALTVPQIGKRRIGFSDLDSSRDARAALGIEVDLSKGHVVPTGDAPTVAAQAALGTGATAAVAGRDTAGVVTLTAGSAALAAGNQAVVTFDEPFATAPVVVLAPTTAAGATVHPYVAAVTATTFTIGFGTASGAAAVIPLNYVVIGR